MIFKYFGACVKVGANKIDVSDAMALDDGARGFGQGGHSVDTVANQRQTAVGCDNLGFGLFQLEGTHSQISLSG